MNRQSVVKVFLVANDMPFQMFFATVIFWIFCYLILVGYLREDVGLLGLFSTGLTASIIGGNIRSVACDAYLKRNVVNYHNKKSVIDTENGPKVFAEETSKLMIARCLGIVASYPFQVVMVRQIAQIVGKETIYSNLINALIDINFEEGLPGLFSGLLPRLLGEVITVWLVASFAYVVNNYVFPEGADPELKQHTPMVASMFVSTVTHRLTVTSTVMAVSGAGLAVSIPFKNSISCYNYLQSRNAFIRGASLFFRYANGPL
ncbi:hypothetical protein AAHC03_013571 [Spirometra sp. Aus1]